MDALTSAFELLSADGPHSDYVDRLMQFGRFVGSWELDVWFYEADATEVQTTAEWHWSWILGGRAIQDVLVFPARSSVSPADGYRYGTSLRVLDVSAEEWKIVWVAPHTATVYKLSGSFSEDGSVELHGDPHDGEPTKWVFTEVTRDAFLWEGFVEDDPETDWRLIQRMVARRTG